MPKYHIVTDSAVRFGNPRLVQDYAITIMPSQIIVGEQRYTDGVDLTDEETLRLFESKTVIPHIMPPSVDNYAAMYTRLLHLYDGVISIHASRDLSRNWHHAREAAQRLTGKPVAVVDSQTICAGQGMLVRLAAQMAQTATDFETLVQNVRGAVERIYSVYYVETLEALHQNGIMSASRMILGTTLGIKPFLSIEDGRMMVIEKVRTRSQAIERLVEFLVEFETLDDAVIVQHRSHISEQTRILQDRLSVEFPGQHFPFTMYGASLAAVLGTEATGVVVLESEIEIDHHDI